MKKITLLLLISMSANGETFEESNRRWEIEHNVALTTAQIELQNNNKLEEVQKKIDLDGLVRSMVLITNPKVKPDGEVYTIHATIDSPLNTPENCYAVSAPMIPNQFVLCVPDNLINKFEQTARYGSTYRIVGRYVDNHRTIDGSPTVVFELSE